MDGRRFDQITRTFAHSTSRRGFVRGMLGSVIAWLLVAVGVRPAEAMRSCVRCRQGVCTPIPNGTRCGQCGVCSDGGCVPTPSSCGPCQYCETLDMTCRPAGREEGDPCGSCGICENGTCKKRASSCDEDCERCRRSRDGRFSCEPRCGSRRCCPGGHCVDQDECCRDQHRCSDNTCCFDDCCGGTCCDARTQQCCGGLCCSSDAVCIDNDLCCLGTPCPIPGENRANCCSGGQVCCTETGVCATSLQECCRDCNPCQKCNADDGSCVYDEAKEGQRCPADGPCAGICRNGQCEKVVQDHRCSDGTMCCAGGCCALSTQTCCGGVCCDAGQCCGGACCDGTCVLGLCCPIGFTAAEVTDVSGAAVPVCCPFGPPCGEQCCGETEQCCGDHCCGAADQCCGTGCCPAAKYCCEGVCRDEPCGCPDGQAECGPDGCCSPGMPCSSDGCCPYDQGIVCGAPLYPGDITKPCCLFATETCNTYMPEQTVPWCCPKDQAHYGDGCCPPDKPFFTSIGCGTSGPHGEFCCDDASLTEHCDNFAAHCTDQPVPGRY